MAARKLKKRQTVPVLLLLAVLISLGVTFTHGRAVVGARFLKADDYTFYLVEAKKAAVFQAKDPSVSLKDIMVIINKDLAMPVYGIYRFSSPATQETIVAYNIATGEKVVPPEAILSFFKKHKVSQAELETERLPMIAAKLAKLKSNWRSIYFARKGGNLAGELQEMDDFSQPSAPKGISL